jgi:hypothetical protein
VRRNLRVDFTKKFEFGIDAVILFNLALESANQFYELSMLMVDRRDTDGKLVSPFNKLHMLIDSNLF